MTLHRLATTVIPVAAALVFSGCEAVQERHPDESVGGGPDCRASTSRLRSRSPPRAPRFRRRTNRSPWLCRTRRQTASGQSLTSSRSPPTPPSATRWLAGKASSRAPTARQPTACPTPSPPDRTYFWRAKALDGANESAYSEAVSFAVVTAAELQAPVPLSPVGASTAASRTPEFRRDAMPPGADQLVRSFTLLRSRRTSRSAR